MRQYEYVLLCYILSTKCDSDGNPIETKAAGTDRISFATQAGASYTIIPKSEIRVEKVAESELSLTVNNVIATVSNATDVTITAYDLLGICLTSVKGNRADLTDFAGSTVIVKATSGSSVVFQKCRI